MKLFSLLTAITIPFTLLWSITGNAENVFSTANATTNKQEKNSATLVQTSANIEAINLEKALSESGNKFAFIAKTFPKYFDADLGESSVEMEFASTYDSLADGEYRTKHKEFVQKFDRIGKHEIVKKGNLPGAVDLNAVELSWWKENFLNQRLKDKKFIDYLGESYSITGIVNSKIMASASPWDAGEARNQEKSPERAYRGVAFTVKLDRPVSKDERFAFFKKQPLWLFDREVGIKRQGRFPEKLSDAKKLVALREAVTKAWPTANIDDRLSFYLLQAGQSQKIYSLSALIDRCKDGWPSWNKCSNSEKTSPWWVYFGIDETGEMIDLGGHMNVGFSHAKENPNYKFNLLGDINRNGYQEFLYYSDNQVEGSNSATIYEIYKGEALPIWNWSDFQE